MEQFGGGERTRTADFYVANVALYQLSYTPVGPSRIAPDARVALTPDQISFPVRTAAWLPRAHGRAAAPSGSQLGLGGINSVDVHLVARPAIRFSATSAQPTKDWAKEVV